LAALLHGTLVVGVSQALRRWTEGATYIRQGGHHVGHWPTFLVSIGISEKPEISYSYFCNDACFIRRYTVLFNDGIWAAMSMLCSKVIAGKRWFSTQIIQGGANTGLSATVIVEEVIDISQGSVATRSTYGYIVSDDFIANLPPSLRRIVKVCQHFAKLRANVYIGWRWRNLSTPYSVPAVLPPWCGQALRNVCYCDIT